jgi:hypothetical protein
MDNVKYDLCRLKFKKIVTITREFSSFLSCVNEILALLGY